MLVWVQNNEKSVCLNWLDASAVAYFVLLHPAGFWLWGLVHSTFLLPVCLVPDASWAEDQGEPARQRNCGHHTGHSWIWYNQFGCWLRAYVTAEAIFFFTFADLLMCWMVYEERFVSGHKNTSILHNIVAVIVIVFFYRAEFNQCSNKNYSNSLLWYESDKDIVSKTFHTSLYILML